MPLAGGQVFLKPGDIPKGSRAQTPPQDLELLRGGQGVRHGARLGADQTRWCVGCDTTLNGSANFCAECARERSRISAQRRRLRDPRTARLRVETLYQVAAATREVEQAILNVIIARQVGHGRVPEEYIDDLMVASKSLAGVVRGDIDPLLPAEDHGPLTPGAAPLRLE